MAFKKATKFASKLRLAIAGPAGAGKTWTALTFATALAQGAGVALIDTEHGSASKYADDFEFDTLELTTFHPQKYIDAIREAEAAGYAVLVIDSLSHAWTGTGGVLEEKDKIAKQKYGGNSFSAWNDATQLQNKLVQALLGSKLHIIATVRSKMDYVLETNDRGKQTPRKVGLAPVQRDDLAYEFDVFGTMEIDNTLIIEKSRCPALSGQVIAKPGAGVAETLKAWLQGAPAPEPSQSRQDEAHVPLPTSVIDKAQSDFASAYAIPDAQIEGRWPKYVAHILGRVVADPDITAVQLAIIHEDIARQNKKRAQNGKEQVAQAS